MVDYPYRYGLGEECRWKAKPPHYTASPGRRPRAGSRNTQAEGTNAHALWGVPEATGTHDGLASHDTHVEDGTAPALRRGGMGGASRLPTACWQATTCRQWAPTPLRCGESPGPPHRLGGANCPRAGKPQHAGGGLTPLRCEEFPGPPHRLGGASRPPTAGWQATTTRRR